MFHNPCFLLRPYFFQGLKDNNSMCVTGFTTFEYRYIRLLWIKGTQTINVKGWVAG